MPFNLCLGFGDSLRGDAGDPVKMPVGTATVVDAVVVVVVAGEVRLPQLAVRGIRRRQNGNGRRKR